MANLNLVFLLWYLPRNTHWIVIIFTKEKLKDKLGKKAYLFVKPGDHLEKADYFNAEKMTLNPEAIDRIIAALFRKWFDSFNKAISEFDVLNLHL